MVEAKTLENYARTIEDPRTRRLFEMLLQQIEHLRERIENLEALDSDD